MSTFFADYPVVGGGVTSLNGLTGALTLVGAGGITITPSGTTITITGSGGTVNTIGPIDSTTPSANGAVILSNALIMQSASATVPGLVNNTAQTLSGSKTFSSPVLISDGSVSAPGLAFSNETGTGLFRIGTKDIALSMSGSQFYEAKYVSDIHGNTNVNWAFGPSGNISNDPNTPSVFFTTYNGNASFVYTNGSTSSTSVTTLLAGNGTGPNFTTVENWANNTANTYLGGGSAVFASPNQTQLIIGSENTNLTNNFIGFTVGGRTLTTERMRLKSSSLTLNSGVQMLGINGSNSAPGYSFSSGTNTGIYRTSSLGLDSLTLSLNGNDALIANNIGSGNYTFGFGQSAGATGANPLNAAITYAGTANFAYANLSASSVSKTVFYIGNGPGGGNPITIENASYSTSGYLAGGGAIFASPNLSQLNIGAETTSGYLALNVGGRTLAKEAVRIGQSGTNMSVNSGWNLVVPSNKIGIGTSSPSYKLDIESTSAGQGNPLAYINYTGSGTEVDNLVLDSNSNTGMVITNHGLGLSSGLYIGNDGGSGTSPNFQLCNRANGYITVRVNNVDVLTATAANKLVFADGTQGTSGYVWTSIDAAGTGSWMPAPAAASTLSPIFFGDGSDGSAVLDGINTFPWASLSGSTYTIIRQQNLINLTINSGITVIPNGYILIGTGTLSNAGTIDQSGKAGANGNAVSGASGGLPAGVNVNGISATDLLDAGTGQNGEPQGTGTGGNGDSQQDTTFYPPYGGTSGTGGNGGTGTAGSGGTGGTPILSSNQYYFKRVTSHFIGQGTSQVSAGSVYTIGCGNGGASGAGGAGDGVNNGGGGGAGGGGGGVFAAFFNSIINSGTITVNGGAGGNGESPGAGNCGGGGGGAGGDAGMIYLLANAFSGGGTYSAVGGAGGAKGNLSGTGTDGTAGTSGAAGVVLKYNGTTNSWV